MEKGEVNAEFSRKIPYRIEEGPRDHLRAPEVAGTERCRFLLSGPAGARSVRGRRASRFPLAGERIGEGGRCLLGRRTAGRGTAFALRASAASARRGQARGVRRARGRGRGNPLGRVSPEAWRRRAGERPFFEGDPSAGRKDREAREGGCVGDGGVVGTPRQPHRTGDRGRRKIFSGSPDAKEDCTRTARACAVD